MHSSKPVERHLLGVALMLIGMLIFPVGDSAAKFLSSGYSPILLSWVKFAIGFSMLFPTTLLIKSEPLKLDRRMAFEQILRAILITSATIFFIAAISEVPLADAVGAYFTAPIIAGLLAIHVLGEKFTIMKALATFFGFCGMLLIVKPSASIEIGFIYALIAGLCFGSFLVVTRWSIREVSSLKVVAFQTLFGTLLLLPFVLHEIASVRMSDIPLFLVVGLASVVGNILAISALKMAPAGLLAPLVYFEIVGAVILGYFIFGDLPSLMTIAGVIVVIIGGLLLIERKVAAKL